MSYYIDLRKRNKSRAIDILGGVCIKCGTTDRLEFGHIDNERKEFKETIGYLLICRWERIEEELKKCQLLCRFCHQNKSLTERGYAPGAHGISAYQKRGCRCEVCKKASCDSSKRWRDNNREKCLEKNNRKKEIRAANKIKKIFVPKPITHGFTTGYRRGCRCVDCSLAHKEYLSSYRQRNLAVA